MRPSRLPLASLLFLATFPLAACSGPYDASDDEYLDEAASAIKVCPGPVTTLGIDVSHWQGTNINWSSVKNAGVKYAFLKATESTYYKDDTFNVNWSGTKANGILRGAYHFFRADADGVAQANEFVAKMGALGPDDMPPVLDLETTDGQGPNTIANRALAFLKRVEELTGRKPIIYTGYYFWKDSVTHLPEFAAYPLWLPAYVNDPKTSCPLVFEGTWDKFTFWQYSSTGSVSGIGGDVDMNLFDGSLDDLKSFVGGAGSAPLPAQLTGNDAMTFVNWPADKHAEVFVTTTTGDLLHTWSSGETDTWQPLAKLDSGAECGLSAGWPSSKNAVDVFSPKADGTTSQISFDGTMWNTLQGFGGKGLSKLSTLAWPDGHMEVFARGDDGAIWHKFYFEDTGWSDWQSMGGTAATGVSPIVWGDGHAELLITDPDGTPWLNFSGEFEGGWFGWLKLEGKLASRPVPVRWADGHIELFARGADGYLHNAVFNGQKWGPFQPLATNIKIEGEPSVFMNPGGNGSGVAGPEVVARDSSGNVVHLWWDGAGYTDFEPLLDQVTASDPFGWMRADGHAEVFAIDANGALVRTYRGDAGWTAWSSLGGDNLNPCVPGGDPGTGAGGGSSSGSGSSSSGAGAGAGAPVAPGAEGSCTFRAGANGGEGMPSGLFAAALAPLLLLLRRRRS